MRTQRNTFPEETSGKGLNEMDVSNLPAEEFKVIVIKKLTELRRRMQQPVGGDVNRRPRSCPQATCRLVGRHTFNELLQQNEMQVMNRGGRKKYRNIQEV